MYVSIEDVELFLKKLLFIIYIKQNIKENIGYITNINLVAASFLGYNKSELLSFF